MTSLNEYLELLSESPEPVLRLVVAAAVMLVVHALTGWALFAWPTASRDEADRQPSPVPFGGRLLQCVGAGIGLNILLWTGSLFIVPSAIPGTAAAGVLALAGIVGTVRNRRRWAISRRPASWVAAVLLAAGFGLWQHALLEFPLRVQRVFHSIYNDFWRDLPIHVHVATLIGEGGLPLRCVFGTPDPARPFEPPGHVGYAVWMDGVSSITGVGPYHAAAVVWILCRLLTAWSAWELLGDRIRSPWLRVLASLVPLVLGGVGWPPWSISTDLEKVAAAGSQVAGAMSWNLPQAASVAIAFVSMVFYDQYCRWRRTPDLFLTAFLQVVSGLCKPSLFIVLGPALLIRLVLQRTSWRKTAGVVAILLSGVGVYHLPLLYPVFSLSRGWSLHPSAGQARDVLSFFLGKCGGVFLLSLPFLRKLFRDLGRPAERRPVDLLLIAMGGSLLFPLLFREEDLVPLGMQPNLFWGAMGCLSLLWPFVAALPPGPVPPATLWGRRFAWLVVGVQILNGGLFAFQYPVLETRHFPTRAVDLIYAVRRETAPQDRVLLDPIVSDSTRASYLGRPVVMAYELNWSQQKLMDDWRRLCGGESPETPIDWNRFEAVVTAPERDRVHDLLRSLDWAPRELPLGFTLWRKPLAGSP